MYSVKPSDCDKLISFSVLIKSSSDTDNNLAFTKFICERTGLEIYIKNDNNLSKISNIVINNHVCVIKNYSSGVFKWCGNKYKCTKNLINISKLKIKCPTFKKKINKNIKFEAGFLERTLFYEKPKKKVEFAPFDFSKNSLIIEQTDITTNKTPTYYFSSDNGNLSTDIDQSC